jgi:hypothetical protein
MALLNYFSILIICYGIYVLLVGFNLLPPFRGRSVPGVRRYQIWLGLLCVAAGVFLLTFSAL